MTSYLINDYIINIDIEDIEIQFNKSYKEQYIINVSLQDYLKKIKMEIDKYIDKWDIYKKITNKYEYINSEINIIKQNINLPVCSYKPISRSYFKMIEILNIFSFQFNETSIKSFHLAEGPGGFMEAISTYRNNNNDKYYGMTLLNNNKNIPKWNKNNSFFINNKSKIVLFDGPKKDGNLYFKHNLKYLKENLKNEFDFITGDGGFDYSTDFNKQEINSINLIFSEVVYALFLQKEKGSFVLKVFDIFHKNTLEILYLLAYFYEKIYIYKPNTSREANSEKYLICIGFKKNKNYEEIINKIYNSFENLSENKLVQIFNHNMNIFFLNKMQDINAIYGQQQIENILQTINYICDKSINLNERIDKIKLSNLNKCIKWCKDYNQPINQVFLQDLNIL